MRSAWGNRIGIAGAWMGGAISAHGNTPTSYLIGFAVVVVAAVVAGIVDIMLDERRRQR